MSTPRVSGASAAVAVASVGRANPVRVCFERMDENKDGKVGKTALKEILRALNRPYTETEMGNFVGEEFDYYQVANFAASRNFHRQAVEEAFRGLTGGALSANADLLKFWMTTMGEELTDDDLDQIFDLMEIEPGGIFSVEVFLDMVEGLYKKLHLDDDSNW